MNKDIPLNERVNALSVNPDAADRHDVAEMAATIQAQAEQITNLTQQNEALFDKVEAQAEQITRLTKIIVNQYNYHFNHLGNIDKVKILELVKAAQPQGGDKDE